jgi:glycosyltransferase involved in cell wall biosynthesis
MKLSVIIPVYNEQATVAELIKRVKKAKASLKEIILVDDASTDKSAGILKKIAKNDRLLKLVVHPKNHGKGAAIHSGLKHVTGDIVLIQDADLEYSPADYPKLLKPITSGKVKVVYGSRFLGKKVSFKLLSFIANKVLSLLTRILYRTSMTDMETCYKVFTTKVIKSIHLSANRFDFEPEVTAKILKKGLKIQEVPISYQGRHKYEGKKIGWKDGFAAIWTLLKYRFVD